MCVEVPSNDEAVLGKKGRLDRDGLFHLHGWQYAEMTSSLEPSDSLILILVASLVSSQGKGGGAN